MWIHLALTCVWGIIQTTWGTLVSYSQVRRRSLSVEEVSPQIGCVCGAATSSIVSLLQTIVKFKLNQTKTRPREENGLIRLRLDTHLVFVLCPFVQAEAVQQQPGPEASSMHSDCRLLWAER
ncbi:hypothetical protein AMECASPLE_023026 [Ameca splendens]|uniref:Uncharacterized protein n=1 Tax=Ameca splendens TaxID=208324 RepID=A0ABV1ABF9_9TELE